MNFSLVFIFFFMYANKTMSELRFYEQVLVLHPDSSEEEQKEICQSISQIIEKSQGEIFRLDTWGSRPIANPKRKKATRGFYFHLLFSAQPHSISEMNYQFSINRKVLYFHEERLGKKETPESSMKKYLECLEYTAQKEKEAQARLQKRLASKP